MIKNYLKEKIGNPELFTGRKKEIESLLKWINGIKREVSKSTAILSRRKTGKSALMQRLYNLTFHENDNVVPFYFEIKEANQWLGDFAENFFLAFIYQYLAFKTRKSEYISRAEMGNIDDALQIAREEKYDFVIMVIQAVRGLSEAGKTDRMWDVVRECPRTIAGHYDERIVQMIDEFQFINRFIFWDKEKKQVADGLAGSYFHTCEYKNAPLLVSGSWIGWLMDDLGRMLPGRFVRRPMKNMPEHEAVEMIFKYSFWTQTPVTEQTAYLMAELAEGNPHYISALFDSLSDGKDLSTENGLRKTLEYETMDTEGAIHAAWMEYIDSAFPRINDVYAKDMVLYLSKHRGRKVGRSELKEKLKIEISDPELEKKLKALFKADMIEEHYGVYRGVQDNIFDKIFRRNYTDDIDKFISEEAPNEYKALFEKMQKKYKRLSGKYSRIKGAWAEFMVCRHLRSDAYENNDLFKSMMNNLPDDFRFVEYERVWSYNSPPLHEPEFQIDIFAKSGRENYSLIGEIKNRKAKFSIKEAKTFQEKAQELMTLEDVRKAALFVLSTGGFHKNTLAYLKKEQIAWSDDSRWLED